MENNLDEEEVLYLMTLPDELIEQLNETEVVQLVKKQPCDWTLELREKVKPFADDDLLELL